MLSLTYFEEIFSAPIHHKEVMRGQGVQLKFYSSSRDGVDFAIRLRRANFPTMWDFADESRFSDRPRFSLETAEAGELDQSSYDVAMSGPFGGII